MYACRHRKGIQSFLICRIGADIKGRDPEAPTQDIQKRQEIGIVRRIPVKEGDACCGVVIISPIQISVS